MGQKSKSAISHIMGQERAKLCMHARSTMGVANGLGRGKIGREHITQASIPAGSGAPVRGPSQSSSCTCPRCWHLRGGSCGSCGRRLWKLPRLGWGFNQLSGDLAAWTREQQHANYGTRGNPKAGKCTPAWVVASLRSWRGGLSPKQHLFQGHPPMQRSSPRDSAGLSSAPPSIMVAPCGW